MTIPVGKRLWFYTGGKIGYYFLNNGTDFGIYNHDDYCVLSLNPSRVPTIINGVSLATATPLQEYALPLAEGFTQLRDCTYCKTQESMVHIELSVKGNITQGSEVLIATLPEGFRPKRPVRPVAHSHNSPFASGAALIYTDGRIVVVFPSVQTNCNLVCDFLAAN